MNKERIEQIARECGWPPLMLHPIVIEKLMEFAQAIRNEALEEACKAVYGNAESDNVAQRTVDAIRRLKVT